MTIHLIKLSVGTESIDDLAEWQARQLKKKKRELIHITRHMPKRAKEVLDGGSIYWVIKGWIAARQRILELRPVKWEGIPHCGIVYDKELIRVKPRQLRPFQGWRYFDPNDAPPDMLVTDDDYDVPEDMRKELIELGLL